MPFWQFFRNRLIGWIGHALLMQPSTTTCWFFFLFHNLIFIYFFEYETVVRSSGLSFSDSDPDPSSVNGLPFALCKYISNSRSWSSKGRFHYLYIFFLQFLHIQLSYYISHKIIFCNSLCLTKRKNDFDRKYLYERDGSRATWNLESFAF